MKRANCLSNGYHNDLEWKQLWLSRQDYAGESVAEISTVMISTIALIAYFVVGFMVVAGSWLLGAS